MSEQWISVKDRLPKGEPIWVSFKSGNVTLWTVYGNELANTITHWMPATLPDPPKNEAEIAFEKWAVDRSLAYDYERLKTAFLAGWQAHEKRGEG